MLLWRNVDKAGLLVHFQELVVFRRCRIRGRSLHLVVVGGLGLRVSLLHAGQRMRRQSSAGQDLVVAAVVQVVAESRRLVRHRFRLLHKLATHLLRREGRLKENVVAVVAAQIGGLDVGVLEHVNCRRLLRVD